MSIRENFKPYHLCPCQSGKKAKFCCWISKGRWNKAPALVQVRPIPVEDYAHPKCYASLTKKCSTKITREHFISHNILKLVYDRGVKITGLSWIDYKTGKHLPTESLASKILCENHNQALSDLDAQMGRFF